MLDYCGFNVVICFMFVDTEGRIKRKRGIQHAKDVWNLPMGERIVIKCNRFGQPLKKGGGILSGWLGLVARMGNWCPIGYKRWKIVPSRYKIDVLNLTRVIVFIVLTFIYKL